jgi:predicted amino acid-binding ACT domain protein
MIEVNFNIDSISQPVDAEELMMKVLVQEPCGRRI